MFACHNVLFCSNIVQFFFFLQEKKKKDKKEESEPQETVGNPPNFHYKLVDQSVMLGNPAILTVTNTTAPEPEVEWFRDSIPVDINNPKYAFKQDKGLLLSVLFFYLLFFMH